LKKLRFLDHYAANIKRAVNLNPGKLVRLKSHDYHILIERLVQWFHEHVISSMPIFFLT
jgi:hypothetical protein